MTIPPRVKIQINIKTHVKKKCAGFSEKHEYILKVFSSVSDLCKCRALLNEEHKKVWYIVDYRILQSFIAI